MTTQSISPADIEKQIITLVAENISIAADEVSRDSLFEDDLNYDSIDMIEFVMQVEETYNIDVTDHQAADIRTVGQAIDLLLGKLS
ncbi:MAG TPA: acyl carrier protein [Phycisphaerales bacterium]|nr:acyl carrier protein [Phycisphaerales bacterium]HCD32951.1 acyl carrier protein [Phycisphaerales bacterium]|tara:strand:- start:147 stop:404 length:258 start_codon:yes stop_codon:yes gene_type:complete